MYGNWGKLLKVDLTSGEIADWEIDEEAYRDFLGGSGLAAYLFFKLKGYEADPLSPDNPLFIVGGPLSGTSLPGMLPPGDLRPLSPHRHLGGIEHRGPGGAAAQGHRLRRHRLRRLVIQAGLPLSQRRGRGAARRLPPVGHGYLRDGVGPEGGDWRQTVPGPVHRSGR